MTVNNIFLYSNETIDYICTIEPHIYTWEHELCSNRYHSNLMDWTY